MPLPQSESKEKAMAMKKKNEAYVLFLLILTFVASFISSLESRWFGGPGKLEREVEAEKTVFCFCFAETAMQLSSTEKKYMIKDRIQVRFDAHFDIREHLSRVEDVETCKNLQAVSSKDAVF